MYTGDLSTNLSPHSLASTLSLYYISKPVYLMEKQVHVSGSHLLKNDKLKRLNDIFDNMWSLLVA